MQTEALPSWDDLRVLLAIHQHRSFLAAGRALALSTSTVARRVDALERSLGRLLVQRSSAGTLIEPDAMELVTLAEQMDLGLNAMRREPDASSVSGTVRLSMGEGFVRPAIRVLAELRKRHPALSLEVVSETRLADIARREADIGIRKARSASPVLVEKMVGRLRFALYASRAFVDRHAREGRVRAADISKLDFVGYDASMARLPQSEWLAARGVKRFTVRTNSDSALVEAAVLGQGVALLATALGDDLAGLVPLELDAPLPSVPTYLVFHRELKRVPRCRLVLEAVEPALRDALG